MTFAVAIGYDWLHSTWTVPRRQQLREAIVRLGLEQSLPTYDKRTWWSRAVHNWNQVCNGGMAIGALAIAEEEPELAGKILQNALASLPLAMHEFGPDGGWAEGPGYWRYATEYNVYLLAALKTALGNDFGLSQLSGFSETGSFPLYFVGPTGRTFNYADAHDSWRGAPQLFWLATTFDRPAFAAHQRQYADESPSPLDLLWGSDWLTRTSDPQHPPRDRFFEGVSVVFLRSAWDDPQATFVGFKGGDNRANHGQLDLGSFVLDAIGERWFVDLGPDNYNLPGYFGSHRWNFYRCRAEGHNTLVVHSSAGTSSEDVPDQDPRATAPILKFHSQPERAFAITDLSAAYSHKADRVRRGIALVNRRDVLIQDEIVADKANEVWWFAHTPATITLDESNRVATLTQHDKTVYVSLLEPQSATFQVMEAAPLTTSPRVAGQANESQGRHPVRKLALHLAKQNNARITVLISPTNAARANLSPIDQW
jgi:hypothetical protein